LATASINIAMFGFLKNPFPVAPSHPNNNDSCGSNHKTSKHPSQQGTHSTKHPLPTPLQEEGDQKNKVNDDDTRVPKGIVLPHLPLANLQWQDA